MLLGCIADDFSGASDLANMLAKNGMRAAQYIGVPRITAPKTCEAAVVALKTRSVAPAEAARLSMQALDWLLAQGARQILFKYCSTFDSTPLGNIGQVTEALAGRLGTACPIVCPSLPENGRTVFQGHLFVGDKLLSQSGLEHHPLNPMTDPDIRRWLRAQTKSAVGHVACKTVDAGAPAIRAALDVCAAQGCGSAVVDAVSDAHLRAIGLAARTDRLVTGGSGIGLGLAAAFDAQGLLSRVRQPWHGVAGPAAIIAGSCSQATRRQIAAYGESHPVLALDVGAVMSGTVTEDTAARFFIENSENAPLVYSSAEPAAVAAAQERWGREKVSRALDYLFAEVALRLVHAGFTRIVVAGGETSGAVAEAFQRPAFEVGPEIDPGIPALLVPGEPVFGLVLKSGNFGGVDFFERALHRLESPDLRA